MSQTAAADVLRHLPSVDLLLRQPDVAALVGPLARDVVVELIREELAQVRADVLAGTSDAAGTIGGANGKTDGLSGRLVGRVLHRAAAVRRPSLRRAINATGVVLHTNLGRAPLSADAARVMAEVVAGYSTLEFDLDSGGRGSRHTHLEALVCAVTGAEAAVAVNNNAAALLLVLAELAQGREVIVSRGQAVEIGGGFRIPEVLTASGAHLVEVGTTNRTRISDYARAIGPNTAALLHVHTSNFRVIGFTEEVAPVELAALGRERGVPVLDDQGSGCLLDTTTFGIGGTLREPMVQESVRAGVDLVCFSGDKLLGGPQAGIIAGKAAWIGRLKRHPLVRALRLDKAAIAGLAATLLHYRLGEAERAVPVWQMLGAPPEALARRARRWARQLREAGLDATAQRDQSAIGGGSLPGALLPTTVVALAPPTGLSVDAFAARLRQAQPPAMPVIGRIVEERLFLDPRTVLPTDEAPLLAALRASAVEGT